MPYKDKKDLYDNQSRFRKRNFDLFWKILTNSACLDCGESNPIVLEFDHLPEYEKCFNISRAVSGSTRSWNSIEKEIAKCEIVCANCHRVRTATRLDFQRMKNN